MGREIYQRSFSEDVERTDRVRGRPQGQPVRSVLNQQQENIKKWLKQVRFKKAILGGVKEADVWKKIAELNTLYEAALSAERARYDALLEECVTTQAKQMARQMYEQTRRAAEQERAGDVKNE